MDQEMEDFAMQIRSFMDAVPDIAVAIIFAVIIINAIMWFFLPFAIYGIQAKMNKSRKIQEKILKIMERMD